MRKKLAIDNLRIRYFLYFLFGFLVVFLSVIIISHAQIDQKVEKITLSQSKQKQLSLTQAGCLSIENFFKERKSELLLIAQNQAVKSLQETEGRKVLESIVLQAQKRDNFTISIGRADKKGTIVWGANTEDIIGEDNIFIGDRDYFSWAKQAREGEIVATQPFISRGGVHKDNFIILLATPVFSGNQFNGLVFASFSTQEIMKKFILPLAFSSQSKVVLVSDGGEVISSTILDQTGKNIAECFTLQEEKNWEAIREKIIGEKESGVFVYNCRLDPKQEKVETIVSHSQVKINGASWTLFIGAPYNEVAGILWPFRMIKSGGLVIILINN